MIETIERVLGQRAQLDRLPFAHTSFFTNEPMEALAEVMKSEYEAIAASGILVQLDCPDLAMGRHSRFKTLSREEFLRHAEIQVEALDRSRLLSDVTRVLSDQHVNILSASVTTTRDRVAISRFTFEMGDPKHLGHVLKAVRSVDGVFDVYRITSGNS